MSVRTAAAITRIKAIDHRKVLRYSAVSFVAVPITFVTEILPFWGMTLLGLVISTIFVAFAEHQFDSPIMVNVANAFGFGCVWLLKYFVLDKAMFGRERHFPIDESVLEEAEVTEEELVADGFVEGEFEAKWA